MQLKGRKKLSPVTAKSPIGGLREERKWFVPDLSISSYRTILFSDIQKITRQLFKMITRKKQCFHGNLEKDFSFLKVFESTGTKRNGRKHESQFKKIAKNGQDHH